MLPTNVMSFMKKMVSNTEAMNANQLIGGAAPQSSGGGTGGAIGRLRQTLQQAQESVSNRLTQTRTGYLPGTPGTDQQANEQNLGSGDSQQNVQQTPTINCTEEKENQEAARPGDAGRCRVCVKAMKPDEYFKECTECSLKVCDDCASYSSNAEGNETSWRCSVCRRRGVAIIARRVQPGIEQSEVLEGLGCETTIRKSPDARRLQNSGRADSETEVLLLAPKPSDVRRHSDVPLRDIAKFQASVSAATSQHDLGLAVAMPGEKAKSSNDIIQGNKEDGTPTSGGGGPNISISVTVPTGKFPSGGDKSGKDSKAPVKPSGKGAPMKRQRSYERGASEGALNLPVNRGRRASCDMRGVDASSILNNNTIQARDKSGERASTMGIPGLSEKDLQRLQFQHQQHLQQQQRDQPPHQPQGQQQHQNQQHQNQQHHHQQQQPKQPQQSQHPPNQPPQQQQYKPNQQYQQQHQYQQQQQPPQYQQPQQQQQYQSPQGQQQQYQSPQGQQPQYQSPQGQQPQYQQQGQQQYQQQYQQQQGQQQYQPQYQQQGGQPQQYQHQQHHQQQPQQYQQHQQYQQQQHNNQQQQYQQSPQQQQNQQQQIMGRGKAPPSDLAIGNDMRRRSVQIYNTAVKQTPTPRSCASLDTEGLQERSKLQQQQHVGTNDVVKRQGSSTDGEAIKIVIDDVDSTAAKTKIDNNHKNKGQSGIQGPGDPSGDFRTRVVRLRRDPQDRGYQTRGYGLRVVGGCSSPGNPGNLRARVARVTPGSGAEIMGIRRGDIVLTWNGIKLSNNTFEEVCKILDTSGDTVEVTISSLDSDAITVSTVPENEPVTQDWEHDNVQTEAESLSVSQGADQYTATSPTTGRRHLPRLPTEGRIQLRLFHDEVHNTLEISVANIAFGNDDCTTIDLNDIIITLRIGEKIANTRWNQCVLFTKVSPEDLFDSWLILELVRGPDFLGESHVDMGRVSLDDRPVWFPFSAKGSSSHRGSISQIVSPGGNTPPSARELARRLRMRMTGGSQSQSEEQDDSSGQSSPCATSLLRPEVAWEMLGTLGPPSTNLTSRSAPTSRRGSAQSDRGAIGMDGLEEGRGSAPSTPALPRSLPPSRRGSFAFAVEQVINQSRRTSVSFQQRVPDMFMRQLPEIPDGGGVDPSMLRNRRNSAWNPREIGFDRRSQFERTDSLRAMANQPRRTSEATQSFRDVVFEARARLNMQPKRPDPEEWRQQQWAPQ